METFEFEQTNVMTGEVTETRRMTSDEVYELNNHLKDNGSLKLWVLV